ncbi:type IV secretion system protein [Stenotrophomonas maltophilia]|uniref:type IV secretion system protein n=1 Tax=Stenotrophomonas maltophilia TaxID=40324 RepID=UPI0013D91B10|nr:type IV secretion system protein [Stenotrophomonas maltophilia]ELN2584719.1 type IV secretion system protein [Stenotrophomonas maltophilia]ELN2592640.1 type IV secretion system protein [Stenotrophomonas maltophilia]MBA0299977.1 type IV secretion system protein [Stenotrophomonas maltophilia]MBH1401043.1 type IV secretion system protein [Stenotrophomonas maltophilia]MBH1702669.1 type IV secretion system protein [Stenotrophomonas maltophilia]
MTIRSIANFDFSGGFQDLMGHVARVQSIGDFVFFKLILDYLRDRIGKFGFDLMDNMMAWVGGIALTLMTLWVLIQGYRIVTGRSRDSMMVLVTNMARAALIVAVATSMGMFGRDLHEFLTEDVKGLITHVVTGKDQKPEEQIDKSLAWMQVALSSIDGIKILNDPGLQEDKTRAMWFIGLGTGGPAVTAGSMLLLYEVAMALFIGFGPLFILCLLFDQTKQLFQRWLFYGIGTMFSMAVLAAMVSIALDMVIRVSASFWVTALVNKFPLMGASSDGMTSQAMQQGGMGLILTTLILTAPPMAAMFFQGTLGSFMAYSQIGGSPVAQAPGPSGQPPGSFYTPPAPEKGGTHSATTEQVVGSRVTGGSSSPGSAVVDSGRLGLAKNNG